MNTRISFGITVLILSLMFILAGCQGNSDSPVTPSEPGTVQNQQLTGITSSPVNSVLWGYWTVSIDPLTGEVEAIPLRGVQFAANVNVFLEPGHHPGPNLGIAIDTANSDLATNLLAVDVTLNHPLPYDQYSGFDVRGILIHHGSEQAGSDGDLRYGVTGNNTDAVLLNADGWTRWWNPSEFPTHNVLGYVSGALSSFGGMPTASLNGYKVFADGLALDENFRSFIIDPDNAADRGWFGAGSSNTRQYLIQFPEGQTLEYDYCVYASWVETDPSIAGHPDEYEPEDFPVNANSAEAFLIDCDTSDSTMYYVDGSDNGGSLMIDVEVFDWQGILSTGITNEVFEIRVESLDSLIAEPDNTWTISGTDAALVADKGTDISSVYEFEITNLNITNGGTEDLLVTVLNADPDNYDSGFGSAYPEDAPLAAYLFTTVEIGGDSPCPTPVVTSITPNQVMINTSLDDALIEGENFVFGPGFEVKLVYDTTEIIGTDVSNTSSTSFTADFDLTGAPTEVYDVVVTNDCGYSGTGENLFTVSSCISPTVTGITPSCLHTDSYIVDVELSGTDIVDGSSLGVTITDGGSNSASATNLTWVNGELITFDIDLSGLPAGTYDVELTQGCNILLGDSLVGGFTIHDDNTGLGIYNEVGYDGTFDLRNHTSAIEVLLGDDDSSDTIAFFDFDYFGVTYGYFDINSNGAVMLKQDAGDDTSASDILGLCGDDAPYIIPYGEDLDTEDGIDGNVYYEIQGSAPNRTLSVQWVNNKSYDYEGSDDRHTFSVTLYETSNEIRFQYEDPNTENNGSTSGEPPIALCNFEMEGVYYPEQEELFCDLVDWPSTCMDYKAYLAVTPPATIIPPPACTYSSTEMAYDNNYECTGTAHVITASELTETSTTWGIWDEAITSDPIDLGFTFTVSDVDYTQVVLNVNGSVTFGNTAAPEASVGLNDYETPELDIISASSDDLDNDFDEDDIPDGEIKYESRTVGGFEVFIFEWEDVPSYYSGGQNTFQIVLINDPAEDTCDRIIVQWYEMLETNNDTIFNYNYDELYQIYVDGGQPVPGAIEIYPM